MDYQTLQPSENHAHSANRGFSEAIRELGELLPGGTSINWQGSRRRCSEVLQGLIRVSVASRRLEGLLDGSDYIIGGDEHHVIRLDSEPDRVYKFTHGDNFGCRSYFSPEDPDLTDRHFHGEGNANPFFYLHRWRLLNVVSGQLTRFEGFAREERPGWLPRCCISQPKLDGKNPNPREIRAAMARVGFYEISKEAYLHRSGVLMTDVAPRNIRIVDGRPVPFDAIAQVASEKVLTWVLQTGAFASAPKVEQEEIRLLLEVRRADARSRPA